MTVTETLGALGSWEIQLHDETPDHITAQLGFFGHIAIADGPVDVDAVGAGLLTGARYVGVLRAKDKDTGRTLSGSGMIFWLGDEDGKGDVLETELVFTSQTLAQCVTAIVGPSTAVDVGTVYPKAGTYTGKHQFQTRREALSIVCDAFNVEFRVNGNGTVDVGTAADLYNTEAPDTIIVRKGAGTDMNLVALGGDYEVGENAYDYSTRVVLLGQTIGIGDTPDEVFATGSADAPSVPYVDLFGNPVKMTRTISESGQTSGSVAARAQLQLNRFNRVARSLKVDADEYETEGNFVVGDNVYVYDPDTGIVNAANEVTVRGEVLHPDIVRASGITWPVVQGMTVAFRTPAGVWLDLTPFVTWETGGNELTIGDLPKSLTRAGDNPVQARLDAARNSASDSSIPAAPTGLVLTTFSSLDARGRTVSTINAEWDPIELNADGSVITDLSHYILQYHWTARTTVWQQMFTAADVTETDVLATPSVPYEARVAAVDIAGHQSAWSALATITSAADAVAPPAPADPLVTSYLGQLRIEYVGTDAAGQPMPTDTNRIDVHVGTTSTFTADITTRVSSITPFAKGVAYATAPYSATNNRWVRLIAVDHEGNSSPSSAAVGGHTVQVADGDVASLSVGKLTAGTMTADVTMSGRFATALTGARREMNSVGFQAYDASNNLLINLDGVNNLLTGRFRTALTGRRIDMGASGATGTILFTAPDGKTAEIAGFTATTGVEALRMSAPVTGLSQVWNSVSVDSGQGVFLTSKFVGITGGGGGSDINQAIILRWATSKTEGFSTITRVGVDANSFYVNDPSGVLRFSVSAGQVTVLGSNGQSRFAVFNDFTGFYPDGNGTSGGQVQVKPGFASGTTYASAHLAFWTPGVGGGPTAYTGCLVYNINSDGTQFGLAAVNGDVSAYIPMKSSDFQTVSDGRTKQDIVDARPALAELRATPVREFRRKRADRPHKVRTVKVKGPDGETRDQLVDDGPDQTWIAPEMPLEIGFIAQELPARLTAPMGVGDNPDLLGFSVPQVVAWLVKGFQELADIVDDIPKGRAA